MSAQTEMELARKREIDRERGDRHLTGAALDAEIRRLELALIDREERFLGQAQALGRRVHAAIPSTFGGGAVAGLGLLSWLFKPSARAHAPAGGAAPVASGWARWFTMLWPLMPAGLKARVDPKLLGMFTAFGLPLLERALQHRRNAPRTEPYVDLHRYAGRWFEIARLPESHEKMCAADVTATYRPLDRDRIEVVNRCLRHDGQPESAVGVAEVARNGHGAKLRVNFAPAWLRWLGLAWADYWILRVDRDYDTALVGTPDRKHLWVLSRTPDMAGEDYRRLLDYARIEGYDVDKVRVTEQHLGPEDERRAKRRERERERDRARHAAHA